MNSKLQELNRMIANMQSLIDALPKVLWYKDTDGRYIIVNKSFKEFIGKTREEILGRKDTDLFSGQESELFFNSDLATIGEKTQDHREVHLKNGEYREVFNKPCYDESGNLVAIAGFFRDITAQKQAEEAAYLNYHDQLTGLYNRRFYDEELERIDIKDNLPISLIMADVNGLKLTNDAFGHIEGDRLLQRVACIMKKICRSDDVVARVGGDEFVILLPRTTIREAESIKERISNAVKKGRRNILSSVSLGLGVKNSPEENMKDVYMLAEDRMYHDKLTESKSIRYKTVNIIRETLFKKSASELVHCERVSQLCELTGICMGLRESEVLELKTAGLLHDLGKIGLDEKLLRNTGIFTSEERAEMERHPEIGYHILSSVNEFAGIAEYLLCHHERVDGNGYPRRLREPEIPMQAKIISIADAYDSMTSNRLYKKTLTKDEAIEEILKNSGSQFDMKIAEIFVDCVLKHSQAEDDKNEQNEK